MHLASKVNAFQRDLDGAKKVVNESSLVRSLFQNSLFQNSLFKTICSKTVCLIQNFKNIFTFIVPTKQFWRF